MHRRLVRAALVVAALVPTACTISTLPQQGGVAVTEADIASMPLVPADSPMPPMPDIYRALVVDVKAHLVTPTVDETANQGVAECTSMSVDYARKMGFNVVAPGQGDVTMDFACTGSVQFADDGENVKAIIPPRDTGPAVTVMQKGVVVATYTRTNRQPMRCPSMDGSLNDQMETCGHMYGRMAEAQIATWLASSKELQAIASSK